jgi:hypothetical protein
MKKVFEHIEHIKTKPHHIRKQIAFGTAGVVTTLIAIVWLTSSIGAGTFAIRDNSFAHINGDEGVSVVSGNNNGQLAGAAAAPEVGNSKSPARIQIIDVATSTPSSRKAERTVIPF